MSFDRLIFVCIFFIFSISAAIADETPGQRSCPGGYQHGARFDSGKYWYECRDGQAVPKGCLSDSGRRVEIQDTYDTNENRMQCILDSDGYLSILYKSCVFDGREHMVNDRWDDGKIWYSCQKDGTAVRSVPIGCVEDNRPIAYDDRSTRGEFVYTCKEGASGRPEMGISGCYKNGQKYNIGETYESSPFWYTCADTGSKIVGCVHNGLRLNDGDQYHENDIIYQCTVNDKKTRAVASGCIQHENGVESEKKFGCFWTEGDAPYQYEMTCKYDAEQNKATKVQTRCQYKSNEGIFRVEPGCYAQANGMGVGCIRDSSGQLTTRTFPDAKIDYSVGIREC